MFYLLFLRIWLYTFNAEQQSQGMPGQLDPESLYGLASHSIELFTLDGFRTQMCFAFPCTWISSSLSRKAHDARLVKDLHVELQVRPPFLPLFEGQGWPESGTVSHV